MNWITNSAAIDVRDSGNSTSQKNRIGPAPSMRAASTSSSGTVRKNCLKRKVAVALAINGMVSPAAYLVDLLQFLDVEPEVWGNFLAQWKERHGQQEYPHRDATGKFMTPYDALIERRPDLPHIPLTCENTNTALPYIDLVNEILEYYVANGALAPAAAHDTGEATTAELLAEPQNVIREAYETVRAARYPLTLPFDLWLATVREFTDAFETPLHRLLETFRPGDELLVPTQPYDRAAIFIESLGLSPAEAAILTDPDPLGGDRWQELYLSLIHI